jgi:hypothetical protein
LYRPATAYAVAGAFLAIHILEIAYSDSKAICEPGFCMSHFSYNETDLAGGDRWSPPFSLRIREASLLRPRWMQDVRRLLQETLSFLEEGCLYWQVRLAPQFCIVIVRPTCVPEDISDSHRSEMFVENFPYCA